MAPPGSATLPAFCQGESEVSRGSHPKSNPTDPTPPVGSGCFPVPSTRSSRCQGWGGDEENVGSRGCALLFQGRIWRGEAELSCERIRHLRRLAELTPTAPSPPGLPGGDKPGRGKGDKQGFRGVPGGCRDGITPVEPGDVGQERRWQRQPPRVVTSEGRERKDGFEEAAAGLPEGSLPASRSA